MNGQELLGKLRICIWTVPPNIDTHNSLKYITDNNLIEVYPNTYVTLRIILTIPVTVAPAERSFSKLKLIKTYIRSTMCQERFSALAIPSTEHNSVSKLYYSSVIDKFSTAKCRKTF
jgi:hypothetical protein